METQWRIIQSFHVTILTITILFAFIYSIPIIYIRRFHNHNNIFTLNICLAVILCSLSWLSFWLMSTLDVPYLDVEKIWPFLFGAQTILTIQVPYSFVIVSIHRYCSIAYPTKIFFKTKKWILLCIMSQWILGFTLPIPNFFCIQWV